MTRGSPRMPWFPRDYIAATRHLTLAERGAYSDLLFLSWEMGRLPSSSARLARLLGCTAEEFAEVWPAIAGKFTECLDGSGTLVNPRLEEHRKQYLEFKRKQSDAGKRTADMRWNRGRKVVPFEPEKEGRK